MQSPEPRKPKRVADRSGPPASLALRIDRAASDLNPFLVIAAIGLLILNVTLYLGMAAQQSSARATSGPPAAVALHGAEH
jgi:hypothetical protein